MRVFSTGQPAGKVGVCKTLGCEEEGTPQGARPQASPTALTVRSAAGAAWGQVSSGGCSGDAGQAAVPLWASMSLLSGEGTLANEPPSREPPSQRLGPGELAECRRAGAGARAHTRSLLFLLNTFSHLVPVSLDKIPSVTLSHLLLLLPSLLPNSK